MFDSHAQRNLYKKKQVEGACVLTEIAKKNRFTSLTFDLRAIWFSQKQVKEVDEILFLQKWIGFTSFIL